MQNQIQIKKAGIVLITLNGCEIGKIENGNFLTIEHANWPISDSIHFKSIHRNQSVVEIELED